MHARSTSLQYMFNAHCAFSGYTHREHGYVGKGPSKPHFQKNSPGGAGLGDASIIILQRSMLYIYIYIYILTLCTVAIWGFGWRVGAVHTETTYKQFTNKTISADVGLKVGLYAFNVTLKGEG